MASYVLDVPEPLLNACGQFSALIGWAGGDASAGLTHAEVEHEIVERTREVARLAYQGHLDLRADREPRLAEVVDAAGVARGRAEYGRDRQLTTMVGEVVVERIAYRQHGHPDLTPADARLNLPVEHQSHGLRRLAAVEAVRGSFADAAAAITRATGQTIGKRQVEALTARAAADVDDFYAEHLPDPVDARFALGMSADAKGIVMRTEALRAATAKAAPSRKMATRLSAGEKRGRKRMAEVVAVFDVQPAVRGVEDILPAPGYDPRPGPVTSGKWLAASVQREATDMITWMVDEAHRRDPTHERDWFATVDGNAHHCDTMSLTVSGLTRRRIGYADGVGPRSVSKQSVLAPACVAGNGRVRSIGGSQRVLVPPGGHGLEESRTGERVNPRLMCRHVEPRRWTATAGCRAGRCEATAAAEGWCFCREDTAAPAYRGHPPRLYLRCGKRTNPGWGPGVSVAW